jgi:CheY-like chemotaxis protein
MENKLIYFSEDDPLMMRMFESIFRLSGYDVVIAKDGDEAIAKLETLTKKPAVFVLDVMMPKRSGFEVLEFLKQQEEYRGIPVVMLSNVAGKEDAERAIKMGATAYLVKSQYEPKDIVTKITEIIAAAGTVTA